VKRTCAALCGVLSCGVLLLLDPVLGHADEVPHFVREWGAKGASPGEFEGPRGIAVDAQGILYIADRVSDRVQKFDRSGNLVGGWGHSGSAPGAFNGPVGIAIDEDGNVYVADTGNYRVQKFTRDGSFVAEWGSFGTAPGSFTSLMHLAVDAAANVFVSDGSRVQKFDSNGNFLLTWGSLGWDPGQFRMATGIAVGPDQTVYVATAGTSPADATGHIQRFTNDGAFITRFGSFGEAPQQFQTVLGIETDSQGNVIVLDHHNMRIQKFSGAGGYIGLWGVRGNGPGEFVSLHDVAIDANDDLFIIDMMNRCHDNQEVCNIQHYSYTTAVQPTTWSAFKRLFKSADPATKQ
jgi:sugar lactone lactonase YvrE